MSRRAALVERVAVAIVDDGLDPWQLRSACADHPELVAHPTPDTLGRALSLCARCPVTGECARWAASEPAYEGVSAGVVMGRLRHESEG